MNGSPGERQIPSATQQTLVKGEEGLIDFKDIVVLMGDEILHDDVKFIGMGEGLSLIHISLQNLQQL